MTESTVGRETLWRRRLGRLRDHTRSALLFVSGVLAVLVALLLYNVLTPDPPQLTTQDVADSVAEALASATPPPPYSARVYQAVGPALVFIQTQTEGQRDDVGFGVGSGVVINNVGDILTSLHVVADASDIQLSFADGTQTGAQVIVEQPENDIAVLRPNQPPTRIIPAILGNPNAIRVGDEAFVIGNPLGFYNSMSAGVISGLNRSFRSEEGEQELHRLIQFDAAVNPGNSGGPLLNRNGHVIGIVTALANTGEQDFFIGIGFAVPIDIASAAAGMPLY
jgi:S1-C subfamily serine protease